MTAFEPIRIETTAGPNLAGILHHPRNDDRGLGVVVAHGMLSSKDSDKHRSICEAVAEAGTTGLRFDFRGRGESDGDPTDLTVSNEVEDLLASVAFLRDRGIRRVAAVGSSLGGTVSLLAAARDRGLVGLVTIAAPARFPGRPREAWGGGGRIAEEDLIEVAPGEFIHRGFFTDARRHDPIGVARRVCCPWLIIHGAADDVVPSSDADLLAGANPAAGLEVHATAGHRFDQPDERAWLVNAVAGFVSDLT